MNKREDKMRRIERLAIRSSQHCTKHMYVYHYDQHGSEFRSTSCYRHVYLDADVSTFLGRLSPRTLSGKESTQVNLPGFNSIPTVTTRLEREPTQKLLRMTDFYFPFPKGHCHKVQIPCQKCLEDFPHFERPRDAVAYTESLNDDDAKTVIHGHVRSIESSYQLLQTAISEHGDAILKRWTAMTVEERGELFDHTRPKDAGTTAMEDKLSIVEKYYDLGHKELSAATLKQRAKYRYGVLLWKLDLDTFTKDEKALLGVLQNRTKYPPSKWASLDHELNRFGRTHGILTSRHNNNTYFSILQNENHEYGMPMPYTKERYHKQHSIMAFPNAELLFEGQAKLYAFLLKIVNHLLPESEHTKPHGSTEWNTQGNMFFREVEDEVLPAAEEPGITQLLDGHMRSLPDMDLDQFARCAEKRLSVAKDELFLLQNGTYVLVCALLHNRLIMNQLQIHEGEARIPSSGGM